MSHPLPLRSGRAEVVSSGSELSFQVAERITEIDRLDKKETKHCFTDPEIWVPPYKRSYDMLPAEQPKTGECFITPVRFSKPWKPVEALAFILGSRSEAPTQYLGRRIIECGYIATATQIEWAVMLAIWKEPTGLVWCRKGNFFPLAIGDPRNPVGLAEVREVDEERWVFHVHQLDNGLTYGVESVLQLCNFARR